MCRKGLLIKDYGFLKTHNIQERFVSKRSWVPKDPQHAGKVSLFIKHHGFLQTHLIQDAKLSVTYSKGVDSTPSSLLVIIIIIFKGAIRDSFTISSLHRKPSPTRTLKWPGRNPVQIMCYTSSACHMQQVVLHATWYKGTAQLSSLT